MRIVSVNYSRSIVPEGSCGTGYTQPDYWIVELDDRSQYKVCIDIWYRPIASIKKEFLASLGRLRNAENIEDAFEMFVSQIANKRCPWSEEEILRANEK